MSHFIRPLIRLAFTFGILYLIFTNFGTFLIILFVIFALGYYFFTKLKKKMREQRGTGYKFSFNGQDFSKGNHQGFNFNDFNQQFNNGNFAQQTNLSEINDAKEFFGFESDPVKDEIKKKYKALARKYHPDINDHDDELMKKLNHYKDILMKRFAQ